MHVILATLIAFVGLISSAMALTPGQNDVYVRIVDVGAGHCAVIRAPGPRFMVYDGGQKKLCLKAVREIVKDSPIDLMVISHGDADHIRDARAILNEFTIKNLWRTGLSRNTIVWGDLEKAIKAAPGLNDFNLTEKRIRPGTSFKLGPARVTFIAGWRKWTYSKLSESELKNVISIVVRLSYKGRSVLFAGDTYGRSSDKPDENCVAAEQFMVLNNDNVPIKSDVLIAGHHGSDDASATCFIETVDPAYVVFPAGHHKKYRHPHASTAARFINHGIDPEKNIFRTDRGDDESNENARSPTIEWDYGRIPGCRDKAGDDDVEIILKAVGEIEVEYRNKSNGC